MAHAFPGTELYDYAKEKGFITNAAMMDDGGHQMAHIEVSRPAVENVLEWCASSTTSTSSGPRLAFRVVWQAIINRDMPRLYTEASSFMKLRASI